MATNVNGPLAPTNYPGGLSTNFPSETLGTWVSPDVTSCHTWFDDFDRFTTTQTITITDPGNATVNRDWLLTSTGGGTALVTDGDGGIVVLTNGASDDDNAFVQWQGGSTSVSETFRWASDKALWFKSRFKVSDATQSDLVIGLQITDTTPLDVTDGIFFIKDDGSTTLTFRAEKNGTASTVTTATLADDTYVVVGFVYLPSGNNGSGGAPICNVYLNDVRVGSLTTFTNFPDDEDLTISFGVQNGAAAAKTMTVDYILCSKQR